jgi:hypothetical protein
MKRALAFVAPLLLAGGCAQMDLGESRAKRSLVFLGGVRVDVPDTYGEIRAIDVTTLGAGADTSVFLGWRHGQFVFVKQDECQLLIIIRSRIEAEHAAKMVEAMKGEKACLVDFGESLPPR